MLLCFFLYYKAISTWYIYLQARNSKGIPRSDQNFTSQSIFTFAIYAPTWQKYAQDVTVWKHDSY